MIRTFITLVALFPILATAQNYQTLVPIDANIGNTFQLLRDNPNVQSALQYIEANESNAIQEQIRLTEIPAPPFMEQQRAAYYLEQLQQRGLEDAYIDAEGNVIGIRKGSGNGPTLLIAAHLDTVFPEDVDTTVELRGGRYYAPGIGDDTRGLTALLTVIDTLNQHDFKTEGDIIFTGNVGEEGRGDLRGIKAIFRDHPEIDGFVSIDGVRLSRITTGGTGSRRFEFQFKGPGGHSFGAFGLPSAIHAMGRAISKIADLQTPQYPKTTFTVGTVGGGTSVNSIAADAVMALDMRSNDVELLAQLEQRAKSVALEAVAEENARWNNGEVTVDFVLIGDRPAGSTPTNSPIVQVAALAFDAIGLELDALGISSTDSNVPMSLGIPAITIAGGGNGGGAHSPDEWYAPENSHVGPQTALLIVLALAGLDEVTPPILEERTPRSRNTSVFPPAQARNLERCITAQVELTMTIRPFTEADADFVVQEFDPVFTRFNNSVSLSHPGVLQERAFGSALALQDRHKPDSTYYNRVCNFTDRDLTLLDEIVDWYRSNDLRCHMSLHPAAQSREVLDSLYAKGFRYDGSSWLYYKIPTRRNTDTPKGLRISKVTDSNLTQLFALRSASGLHIDQEVMSKVQHLYLQQNFQFFIASIDDTPAASASLFIHDQLAWLSNATTLEQFRGKGCHAALLRVREQAAASAGCRMLLTDTHFGSSSHRNILKQGFGIAYACAEMGLNSNS